MYFHLIEAQCLHVPNTSALINTYLKSERHLWWRLFLRVLWKSFHLLRECKIVMKSSMNKAPGYGRDWQLYISTIQKACSGSMPSISSEETHLPNGNRQTSWTEIVCALSVCADLIPNSVCAIPLEVYSINMCVWAVCGCLIFEGCPGFSWLWRVCTECP